MSNVLILCGNIGSGKSTISKRYVDEGYVVISRDTIRYGLGNGDYIFNLDYEPIIKDIEVYALRSFLELGVNIIVDECNVSKALRKRIIDIVKYYDYKITIVKLPRLTMLESVARRLQNNHGDTDSDIWKEVWSRFDSMYEEPSLDEGVDYIFTIGE